MFNLQSGVHRQSFPPRRPSPFHKKSIPSSVAVSTPGRNSGSKHTKAVTGLMVDGLNRTVISCGLDGKVKVSF